MPLLPLERGDDINKQFPTLFLSPNRQQLFFLDSRIFFVNSNLLEMVSMQVKRKKTADMPDSPPKRVTRARAAKPPEDVPDKPKTTRITTASMKAAAEKKKKDAAAAKVTAPSAKTTKRKTRNEGGDGEVVDAAKVPEAEEPAAEEKSKVKSVKGEPQPSFAAATEGEAVEIAEVPKTRGRQPKTASKTARAKSEAPKTRGRRKKAAEPVSEPAQPKEQPVEAVPEPEKKLTRGRTAATTTRATAKSTASKTATVPTKKRVKFEEDNDKENVPVQTAGPKKSAMKPTGLNAKPIRKPVTSRTATRGRKAAQRGTTATKTAEQNETMPLSPKKVNQVAKSDPISEDELAGEKTPVRALSKSPTKRGMSPIKDVGSVSKLNFNQPTAPSSPTKSNSGSALSSPPRRPPPSPFKDCLKASPKKVNIGDGISQPVFAPSRTPAKVSLLNESPKRGVFADSAMKPTLLPSKSPLKASLLQSPARRMVCSPMKSSMFASPEKSTTGAGDTTIKSPTKSSPVKAPIFSPDEAISSPFRSAKSPQTHARVHVITDEERDAEAMKSVGSPIQSPQFEKKESIVDPISAQPNADLANDDSVVSESTVLIEDPIAIINNDITNDIDMEDTVLEDVPAAFQGPAFSLGSAALRRVTMDSQSSEDELASPQRIYEVTPLKGPGNSAKSFETPGVIRASQMHPSVGHLPFTPLADRLSSWNPSTTGRRNTLRQAQGMSSLGGATEIPAVEQPTPCMANATPAKVSFFDDEMAIRDDQANTPGSGTAIEQENDLSLFKASLDSQASEEYGDENAMPSNSELLVVEQEADTTMTCTPAKVLTPVRVIQRPGEMHTVSKVPLRPSAEDTPLVVPRQRSRSFGGPLTTVIQSQPTHAENVAVEQPATPVLAPTLAPQTPSSGMRLDADTPGRTVRKGVVPDVLKGAVVHVDVHTTEGADASGIFIDLLTQMGARCVKQWHWNPRNSLDNNNDDLASPQASSPNLSANKIGITHVVYKDGGKRTLEKVRSSNGVVHCVGVGWVLE